MSDDDPLAVAHSILGAIQAAAEAHDAEALLGLFTEDAVLVGTVAANLDRPAVEAYLHAVVGQDDTIRWNYETVQVVDSSNDTLTFVGVGLVGWDEDDETDRFRLTCLVVRESAGWRIRLFHGSVPQG